MNKLTSLLALGLCTSALTSSCAVTDPVTKFVEGAFDTATTTMTAVGGPEGDSLSALEKEVEQLDATRLARGSSAQVKVSVSGSAINATTESTLELASNDVGRVTHDAICKLLSKAGVNAGFVDGEAWTADRSSEMTGPEGSPLVEVTITNFEFKSHGEASHTDEESGAKSGIEYHTLDVDLTLVEYEAGPGSATRPPVFAEATLVAQTQQINTGTSDAITTGNEELDFGRRETEAVLSAALARALSVPEEDGQ